MPRPHSPQLTPAGFQILLALADGERHGYDIMQAIARDSQGAIRLGPTTLYRSIRTLLQAGLIEESDQRPDPEMDDERRRYYRLTPGGREAARAEIGRLRRLLIVAESKTLVDGSINRLVCEGSPARKHRSAGRPVLPCWRVCRILKRGLEPLTTKDK